MLSSHRPEAVLRCVPASCTNMLGSQVVQSALPSRGVVVQNSSCTSAAAWGAPLALDLHILHCCRCGLTFSFFVMRYVMQVERAEAEAYDRVCCRGTAPCVLKVVCCKGWPACVVPFAAANRQRGRQLSELA